MQTLWSQPASIHGIDSAAANADDTSPCDADIHGASIGAEYTGRLNPALSGGHAARIDAFGPPSLSMERRARAPDVRDAVSCLVRRAFSFLERVHREGTRLVRDRTTRAPIL